MTEVKPLKGVFSAGNSTGVGELATTDTIPAANLPAATTSSQGAVELTVASEIDTGTDSTRAISVDQFVASKRNLKRITLVATDPTASLTASTSVKVGVSVESPVTGTIVGVYALNDTAGTTGAGTYDIHLNGTTIMATTKITIDSTEVSSRTAAAAAAISTTAVTAGDVFTFFVDAVQTTPAKGVTYLIEIREA